MDQATTSWADAGRLDRALERLAFIPRWARAATKTASRTVTRIRNGIRKHAKTSFQTSVDVAGAACLTVAAAYLHPAAAWATAGLALLAASWRNR